MRGLDFDYDYMPSSGSYSLTEMVIIGIIVVLAIYWIFIDSAISTYKESKERKRKKELLGKKNKPPF